jgi:hypothetical protein
MQYKSADVMLMWQCVVIGRYDSWTVRHQHSSRLLLLNRTVIHIRGVSVLLYTST